MTIALDRGVRCGNCHERHPTANDVRLCYKAGPTAKGDPIDYYDRATPEHNDHGHCAQCGGTGRFVTGSLNGKPVFGGGPCYRCGGKGFQTCCSALAHRARMRGLRSPGGDRSACCDVVRNDLYDRYGRKVYL